LRASADFVSLGERPIVQRQRRTAVRCEAYGVTDVGRQRKHNEDHVLLRPELDLYVVADGMGGHNAGDVASRLTTTSLRNFYEATQDGADIPSALVIDDDDKNLERDGLRLAVAVRKANRDVHEISQSFRQHHGMGSTVVAVGVDCASARIYVGHVGDSRCYRVRNAAIEQLTRDHSLINDAIALKPDLTPEELARLPKNIITRALGMREDVKVDLRSEDIHPGDVYILCSDGLSGMLSDEEMREIVVSASELREASETLVARANEAGGTDNITALLLKFEADEAFDEAGTDPGDEPTPIDPGPGGVPTGEQDTLLDMPVPPSGPMPPGLANVSQVNVTDDTFPGEDVAPPSSNRTPALAAPRISEPPKKAALKPPGSAGHLHASDRVEPLLVTLCKHCGARVEASKNRFCTDCGQPIPG
jgi:serine/threonine protein phosphatase PrpC